MPGRVSKGEARGFRDRYNSGQSIMQIAKSSGRSTATVWEHLAETGSVRSSMEARKNAEQEGRATCPPTNRKWIDVGRVFDELDESKAWLLGLIFGDGHMSSRGRFLLACGQDRDLAEKSRTILGYNGPLYLTRNCWMLELHSKALAESLSAYGVNGSKTYTMKFPELSAKMVSHFVRGCWEADGTFSRLKTGRLFVKYTSASLRFVESMREVVSTETGVGKAKIQQQRPGDRSRSVSWGALSADRVAEWLYETSDAHMRCDRKYAIWDGGQ